MSPSLFTEEIMISAIGAVGIVAGTEWRFGMDRSGSMEDLKELTRGQGLTVRAVEPVMIKGQPVSSTRIRDLLADGAVDAAREFLGRPHFVRGNVHRGRGRGKNLGFPTVNLDIGSVMVPSGGVYAGAYIIGDKSGPAAINVGPSPTFDDSIPGLEAYLIGWEGDTYGDEVTIVFLQWLRPGKIFPDADALSCQIARDVERTQEVFTPGAIDGILR
jgi:riboflavin kinase/FMN adenylyltransferase